MKQHRSLLVDSDLELTTHSGTRLRLRLKSGQGVIELNDAALLRRLIKRSLFSRRNRGILQETLRVAHLLNPDIDFRVLGRRIARVETKTGGGFVCNLVGLPGLRVWPIQLMSVLFR